MPQGTLKVNTENLLPIIKKWLYSDKEIFLRELVSNACDALNKIKILSEQGEAELDKSELRIEIKVDKEKRTLKISDTGIGMTADEVEKYIAQVAFSGAEEFLGKYKSENEKDQIIGHFGLGFYSAYMVAQTVEIQTLSYQKNAQPVFWSCDGTASYAIDKGSRAFRGTEITLFINEESDEFLEEARLRDILQRYCTFLPFPIFLNDSHINSKEPLWLKPASECTEKEYLDFYHTLYPFDPDPVFWIHLNVDFPFHLKGILYFPKIHKKFDFAQSQMKLFCNRVFVSDNCKDLIPDYLTVLRGAIDSPDIPLNVSRSYLQMDRTVRQLSSHVSKKVSDRLTTLYQTEKEKFLKSWEDVELIIKLGTLQDEKFYERCKDFLVWKTLAGEWVTTADYLERHRTVYKEKIFYTTDEKAPFLDLYKNKGIEVLCSQSPIDSALMNLLEEKFAPAKFQRVDGAIDEAILDEKREKNLLDADGKTEAIKIADYIRKSLSIDKLEVEAKSLASDSLPAFIVLDEEMRRMREYMALSGQQLPPTLAAKRTFVVNTNNKLISTLYALKDKQPELAKDLISQVYDLSLLSQKELSPVDLTSFVERSNRLLETLIQTKATE